MSNTVVGGWMPWDFTLSEEAKEVFKEVMKGFVGVGYTPLAFATQVVHGVNYCFLCQGKGVYPGAVLEVFKVYVFKPLPTDPSTAAHITQIVKVTP